MIGIIIPINPPPSAAGLIVIVPPKLYTFNFADLAFNSAKPLTICINLLVLTFFGTVIGQCYSMYFREAVPSVLVLLAAMLYTMPFSVFTFTKIDSEKLD